MRANDLRTLPTTQVGYDDIGFSENGSESPPLGSEVVRGLEYGMRNVWIDLHEQLAVGCIDKDPPQDLSRCNRNMKPLAR